MQVNYSVLHLITNSTGIRVEPAQIGSPTFVVRTSRNCERTVAIVDSVPPPTPHPQPQYTCQSEHRNFYLIQHSSVFSQLPTFHFRETHFFVLSSIVFCRFCLETREYRLLLIFYTCYTPFPPGIKNSPVPAKNLNRNNL